MTNINAKSQPKMVAFEATIIRADGTTEHLGTVSYWHRNPLRRLAFRVKKKVTTWHHS